METMIEFSDVTKSYGEKIAVDRLSLAVEKESFFAFLGPNGAGKSTTIAILSTLARKDQGKILIHDYDIDTQAKRIRSELGIVFQGSRLDGSLSGYENLMLRSGLYPALADATGQVKTIAHMCEVQEYLHQRVDTLSGGQRRRLDIARALLPNPSLLILDEPTTGLDPCSRKEIWNMILKLKEELHMTIFLTTHDMEEAKQADQLCILMHGKKQAQGSVSELTQRYVNHHLSLYSKRPQAVIQQLTFRRTPWREEKNSVVAEVHSMREALSILRSCEQFLEDFEMAHGSLDEVYRSIVKGEVL